MKEKVRCPKCGRKQTKQGPDTIYRCDRCQVSFDDDPDEGGTYSNRDPSARIQAAERIRRGPR